MESHEIYEATKDALTDTLAAVKVRPVMMRIDPFEAENGEGDQLHVIGVVDEGDILQFIVIEEYEDGEIYPISRESIYEKGTHAAALAEAA
jgi:hypothetical protein